MSAPRAFTARPRRCTCATTPHALTTEQISKTVLAMVEATRNGNTDLVDCYAQRLEPCPTANPRPRPGCAQLTQERDEALAEVKRLRVRVGRWQGIASTRRQLGDRLRDERDQFRVERGQALAERDGAYRERAQLVAHLAGLHPSHLAYTDPDVPTWPVVTIETPSGQMCWHINPTDLDLFDHVTWVDPVAIGWDGHTTEEKYQRLAELTQSVRTLLSHQTTAADLADTGARAVLRRAVAKLRTLHPCNCINAAIAAINPDADKDA